MSGPGYAPARAAFERADPARRDATTQFFVAYAAQLLRSLLVIFGSAFTLKFIVLAALSNPDGGAVKRILLALFEGVTLGTFTQEVLHPASGYLAFVTLLLFVGGLALLPSSGSRPFAGPADRKYLYQNSLEP